MAENHEESSPFTIRKKVDESWKNSVHLEKETVSRQPRAEGAKAHPNFPLFVSNLGFQILLALGEPVGEIEAQPADLPQAKFLIDTLQMFFEKTKGNLTPEEEQMLQNLLYEVRTKFVQKSQAPA